MIRILIFCHSLISDWNHGNAHFLRGVATELIERGHELRVYEPDNSWSVQNLLQETGEAPSQGFYEAYPSLRSTRYRLDTLDLETTIADADLVLVHEWNDHELIRRLGSCRAASSRFKLLFHDTHHRSVTDPGSMALYDLSHYDGVLAFGRVIRDLYLERGWAQQAWTWHEAADTRVFHPVPGDRYGGDVVWIGNWGDDERAAELEEFLLAPIRTLQLKARVHGVRYPETALRALRAAGAEYAGWLPNFLAPVVFSRFKATVHVPRRPYVRALPGIPTIRPFEALACGIPLVSAPWDDVEGLFTPGKDFLMVKSGLEMERALRNLMQDDAMARELAAHGLATILARHTCSHRVDELLGIYESLLPVAAQASVAVPPIGGRGGLALGKL